eukprot:671799-Prorocentrum_minimum.AAC.1
MVMMMMMMMMMDRLAGRFRCRTHSSSRLMTTIYRRFMGDKSSSSDASLRGSCNESALRDDPSSSSSSSPSSSET